MAHCCERSVSNNERALTALFILKLENQTVLQLARLDLGLVDVVVNV